MSRKWRARLAVVVELFFDGVMLLCFIAQAFVVGCLLTYGHIPLPSKWSSQSITDQLPEGMSVVAESYALAFDGTLRLQNLQVRLDGLQQPIFDAEYAHLEFDTKWDRTAPIKFKECTLTSGVLTLPAVYSPSGNDSPILDRISLRLTPTTTGFSVDSFTALHEDIRLRGSADWTPKKRTRMPVNIREQVDSFFKHVAAATKEKELINGLKKPTLFFQIDATSDDVTQLRGRISSPSYDLPNVRGNNLALTATFFLTEQTVRSSNILLEAGSIEIPAFNTRATKLSAKVERDDWEALLKGRWPEMEVAAGKITVDKIDLDAPQIRLRPKNFPEIDFDGTTSGLTGAIQFSGSINASTRAANINAEGSLDLLSIAPDTVAKQLPQITIRESPHYIVEATFDEGFLLKNAEIRARVDQLGVKDLNFDHIRFRGSYQNGVYAIHRLYVRRGWQWLKLGFSFDNNIKDYALTMEGSAKPDDYNSILPGWWAGIFKEIDFENAAGSLGNFVIYGNAANKSADFFFGHVKAKNLSYKGVLIDKGDLFVRGRGPYAEIYKLNARKGDGYAYGSIRFASRIDEVKDPMSIRLDLDTMLPLSVAEKLFDEDIANILSEFETDAMPQVQLKGTVFNASYPEFKRFSHISLTVNCPSPISYKGIPMDYLGFDLFGIASTTYLRHLKFGYAGGDGMAEVDITTSGEAAPEARFRATLRDANQYQAISQLNALSNNAASPEIVTSSEKGRLDLEIQAQGPVNNLLQMDGFGNFHIKNEELYAIQLLGPLSKLVQNTRIGFTSFQLNEMEADFSIRDRNINFSKFDISGPRTRVEAPGSMSLDNFALDMRVSVYLFGNAGNPESNLSKIRNIINKPIPNLLVFDLTGTPENQKWQSRYDPRKLLPIF